MNSIYILPIVLTFPLVLLTIRYLANIAKGKRLALAPVKTVYTAQGKIVRVLYNGHYVTVRAINRCKIRRF